LIPRLKPNLTKSEIITLFSFNSKADIHEYELTFARLMGQSHAVFFPYGRTALMFLLQALDINNKEVICPAYTCVVVPHAIVKSGNEPVFVDSCESDFNMDWDHVEAVTTEKTAVVIATSIFGYPVNLEALKRYSERHPQVLILQDCAHSYAASWNGEPVPRQGKAAFFGSNISKIMTSIFGGMVTTDDEQLYLKLIKLRADKIISPSLFIDFTRRLYLVAVWLGFNESAYAVTNACERAGMLDRLVRYYDETQIDMPSDYLIGPTSTQARVGKIQCERYTQIVDGRISIAKFYDQNLQGVLGLTLPPIISGATYSHYVPRTSQRDEILRHALNSGVQIGQIIEYCIPNMKSYSNRPGAQGLYPVASRMAKESINLPVSLDGSLEKAQRVVDALLSFKS
jgi:perosamine synthetase